MRYSDFQTSFEVFIRWAGEPGRQRVVQTFDEEHAHETACELLNRGYSDVEAVAVYRTRLRSPGEPKPRRVRVWYSGHLVEA
jgi:hypothetical protein